MISVLQASRDGSSRGKGAELSQWEKGHTWKEIADQRGGSKVIGKKRQEIFSWRAEKIDKKEASQDRLGTLPSPCTWSGSSWQHQGLEKGYTVVYSADFMALHEILWDDHMQRAHP